MNRKKIQKEQIMNELEGASLFFNPSIPMTNPPAEPEKPRQPLISPPPDQVSFQSSPIEKATSSISDEKNLTTPYNELASKPASRLASITAINQHDLVKTIRKAVK